MLNDSAFVGVHHGGVNVKALPCPVRGCPFCTLIEAITIVNLKVSYTPGVFRLVSGTIRALGSDHAYSDHMCFQARQRVTSSNEISTPDLA